MKFSLSILIIFFCSVCLAQPGNIKAKRFKLIEYKIDGSHKTVRDEFIKDSFTQLDLYFINKHFYYIPLPKAFVNKKYKNEQVKSTLGYSRDTKRAVYVEYDKASRVTSYGESGCYICSDLGYCCEVKYNTIGQVIQITPVSKWGLMGVGTGYKIYYQANGDIKIIDVFQGGGGIKSNYSEIVLY